MKNYKSILQVRFHDKYREEWDDWEDITDRGLRIKYGETEGDWKKSCKEWIDMGGRYEYRIIRRVDTIDWSICFEK